MSKTFWAKTSESLSEVILRLPTEQRFAVLERVTEKIHVLWSALLMQPPGAERARAVYRMIDSALEKYASEKTDIPCKRGCSACCYLAVDITDDEAELLAEIVEGGHEIDRELLREQYPADTLTKFGSLARDRRRCVFLGKDEACSIYESRPAACRKYLVSGTSEQCQDYNGKTSRVVITPVEVAASAGYSLFEDGTGPMPKKLFETLERRSRS